MIYSSDMIKCGSSCVSPKVLAYDSSQCEHILGFATNFDWVVIYKGFWQF